MTQQSTNTDREGPWTAVWMPWGFPDGRMPEGAGEITLDPWSYMRSVIALAGVDERGPGVGPFAELAWVGAPGHAEEVELRAVVGDLNVAIPLRSGADSAACDPAQIWRDDGEPLSARDLATLGLGAVNKLLRRYMEDDRVVARLGEGWGAVSLPRPGRRGRDPLFYARVALDYVRALEADPRKPVKHMIDTAAAAGDHMTPDEVRARLRRATERGLFERTVKGRKGGTLTAEAVEMLDEAGLLEEGEAQTWRQ